MALRNELRDSDIGKLIVRLDETDSARDSGYDECGISDGSEGDEDNPIREGIAVAGSHCERDTRFARPARPGQRQQAGCSKELDHCGNLAVTPNQAREGDGQWSETERDVRQGGETIERGDSAPPSMGTAAR